MTRTTSRTAPLRALLPAALLLALVAALAPAAPASAAPTEFTITGRGNGHGIGMSQYGAQAQALAGRSAGQILGSYYTGTTVGTRTVDFDPRIAIGNDYSRVQYVARGGTATMTAGTTEFTLQAGAVWDVRPDGAGKCRITKPNEDVVVRACPSVVAGNGARVEVRLPSAGEMKVKGQYDRGVLETVADLVGGTHRIDIVAELPLEQYLYGLAEMPYGWEAAALQTQAIAGRSYALYRLDQVGPDPDRGCSCHLYDSVQDQVWHGYDRETLPMWDRWKAAVDATAGKVVLAPGEVGTRDGIVQTFYSSSSNGRTESKHEVFSPQVWPYMVSVDDDWSRASFNPHRSWQVELGSGWIADRLGFDEVRSITVTERTEAGGAKTVSFVGTKDGSTTSVQLPGLQARSVLGLRSTTMQIATAGSFEDTVGHLFEDDISWLALQEITTGCNDARTRFCPDGTVTRGQMAAFLVRALDLPAGDRSFSDTAGHLFEDDVAALFDAGITTGCSRDGTRFCPDDTVTRGQMAAFLVRALDLPAGSKVFEDTDGHLFQDDVAALSAAGITTGCNDASTRFCPDGTVTRGQMAAFLRRALG